MDPTVEAAWIGVGGAIVGTGAGTILGYRLTEQASRRAHRDATAGQLADLTQCLYPPRDRVDLDAALARLSIGLSAAKISSKAIERLRRVAYDCQDSAQEFAAANKDRPPAINIVTHEQYTELVHALSAVLLRTGKRRDRNQGLSSLCP